MSAVKRISTVAKYIPNVFYINTSKYDEFVYLDYLAGVFANNNEFSVLLSSDEILYQSLNSHLVALNIKGLNTKLITDKNVIAYLAEQETAPFTNKLLNVVLSVTGSKDYTIDGLKNVKFKKSVKMVSDLISSGKLSDTYNYACPKEALKCSPNLAEDIDKIEANYKAIYPIEILSNEMSNIKLDVDVAIKTKPQVTYNQFDELNSRIFLQFPLNIASILKGEIDK